MFHGKTNDVTCGMKTAFSILLWTFALVTVFCADDRAYAEDGWKAGVAKVRITPREPMWMSGYGSRTKPSEGTVHDLWAKALAVEDPAGYRGVLVTMDLLGIDRATSLAVRTELEKKHGLQRSQVILNCSHTHGGPVVGRNLSAMYFLSEDDWQRIDDYTTWLKQQVIGVVDAALRDLAPCRLEWGEGQADFAVNRRNNPHNQVVELRKKGLLKGPVDHSVPLLKVTSGAGDLKAIAFGYACHPTKLGNYYRWCGDYAGFTQLQVEKAYPGATALFWQGCCGDQTPWPRAGADISQAEATGRQLADAVRARMSQHLTEVRGRLATAYGEINLRLDRLPTREELTQQAESSNRYIARRAQLLLARIEAGQPLPQSYPYPVQAWRIGEKLLLIALGGEVVVDFALRLKRELGPERTWVAGYSNDVMAYIPSRRVLEEGGYEGEKSMIYYGLPTVWAPNVEEDIVAQVHVLLKKLTR